MVLNVFMSFIHLYKPLFGPSVCLSIHPSVPPSIRPSLCLSNGLYLNKVIRPKSRASALSEKSGRQTDDGWTDGRTYRWLDGQMDGWTDRRRDGWTDGQTKNLLIEVYEWYRNIQKHLNVFKLGETPFKQLCDGRTDRPTDQPKSGFQRFINALETFKNI